MRATSTGLTIVVEEDTAEAATMIDVVMIRNAVHTDDGSRGVDRYSSSGWEDRYSGQGSGSRVGSDYYGRDSRRTNNNAGYGEPVSSRHNRDGYGGGRTLDRLSAIYLGATAPPNKACLLLTRFNLLASQRRSSVIQIISTTALLPYNRFIILVPLAALRCRGAELEDTFS